ncbi:MAG: hypothetical protein DDT40_01513 [candidate division WS2 bacterium]|nr:hypothetical protein [Candidatus Psychracetigena formicireducens]
MRNWQKCLEYSSGEFIKILFSDDWIEKTFVEKCMKILLAHEDVGFVYTKTYITDDDKKYSYINDIEGKKEREYFVSESIKIPYGKTPLSPGCALFRKEDVVIENNIPNSLSLDHENTGAGIDLLIYLNSLKKYKYCYCTSNTIAYFRKHKGSITVKERDTIWKYYFTALLYYIRKEDITDRVYDLRVSVLKSFTLKDFIRSNKLLESYGFDDCSINKWDLIWIAVEKSKTIAGTIRDVLNKDRTVGC